MISNDVLVMSGYYCPGGNYAANQSEYACPAGTYTNRYNLTTSSECETCPQGVACLVCTGGSQKQPVPCAQGHYCPTGTGAPNETPCAAGSFTNRTNLYRQTDCDTCPRGLYCIEASIAPTGQCFQGHYCPDGKYTCTDLSYILLFRKTFCRSMQDKTRE